MTGNSVTYTVDAEFVEDQPAADAQALLAELQDTNDITSVSVTVTASEPLGRQSSGGTASAPETGDSHETPSEDEKSSPSVQSGSDAFHVLQFVNQEKSWIVSDTVRDELAGTVNIDALSSTLYSLESRGLVDKRPYEDDKRKREYRITDLGSDALDATDE